LIRKKSERPRPKRRALRIFLSAIGVALLLLLWMGRGLYPATPQFYYLLLEKNDQPLKLLNGDTFECHPQDKVKIIEISTNVLFNAGIRLVSKDFDVTALRYEKMPLSALLPNPALLGKYQFKVTVKRYNADLGSIGFVIEPYVEDWLDKVERTIDPERRIDLLEEARQAAPQDEKIRERLIQEYRSLKRWPQAAKLLEEMVKEKPDEQKLFELYEVYENMNDSAGAVSVLKRLLQKTPDDAELRLRLARTFEKAKKLPEAILEYEAALSRLAPKEKLAVYKTLGFLYTETADPQKAIGSYLKAAELDKKDVNLYYNLATLYERIGDKEKADQFLAQAVALQPKDIENRLNLAESLFNKGKLDEAQAYLDEVIRRKPDSLRALLLLVQIADKKGDKKRLKDLYEKVYALAPDNEIVLYNLAVLEYEAGNSGKSISHFETYLKNHPKDAETLGFLFDLYKKEKKDDSAFATAKALLALNPGDTAPYPFVFEYLNARNDFKQMAEIMEKGIQAHPEIVDLRQYLVFALLKMGEEDEASIQLAQLAKLKPKDVNLLLQLARLQESQGKMKEAMETYKRILEISPGLQEAEDAYLNLRLNQLPLERQGQ
jgi:tetratricopeptide (TPR) repeat protein